jgi:DnaK suppressor protein
MAAPDGAAAFQPGKAARRIPVHESEAKWTAAEVRAVAAELEADIARLRGELVDAEGELDDLLRDSGGAGDDQADTGSRALEREQSLTLVNNVRDMILHSELALARLTAGSFGRCEACGRPIGKARIQAFPRAVLCVECKQREERR